MNTIDEVVAKFPGEVAEKYDFTGAVYTGALVRIEGVVCPEHGTFSQYAAQFRRGRGCPSCGNAQRADTRRLPVQEFVERAHIVHGEKYSYEKVVYVTAWAKVLITCPVHGEFLQSPQKHMEGRGCPVCGAATRGMRKDIPAAAKKSADSKKLKFAASFVARARVIHGDMYDYSAAVYVGMRSPIKVTCKRHGEFELLAGKHLHSENGCPVCSHHISKAEIDIADFLRTFTTVEQSRRDIISPKELDIFLPEHNLAIEYCGMYYHSHYDAADEAKNKRKHIEKYRLCAEKGIRLITVYESEWNERRPQVKRLLRNVIGKSRGSLMARKCEVRTVGHEPAKRFFDKYHIQGGSGSGAAYGLFHNGELVACMRFSLGANDRGAAGANREWTLARYATRVTVVGGASRLLKAFVDAVNPPTVKSFSDNRYFSGDMYKALGFQMVGESDMDYQVWSSKIGLKPKSHYQRKKLPARQAEHGVLVDFNPESDIRSESQVTYEMKCGRIYDCGKKKWLLTL